MDKREELHYNLIDIFKSSNVYYSPPDDIQINYPCIVYERLEGNTKYANDDPYIIGIRYQVTLIDKRPDNQALERLHQMSTSKFVTHFVEDNLDHNVFYITII